MKGDVVAGADIADGVGSIGDEFMSLDGSLIIALGTADSAGALSNAPED